MLKEERKREILEMCRNSMHKRFQERAHLIGSPDEYGEPVEFNSTMSEATANAITDMCRDLTTNEEVAFASRVIDTIRLQMLEECDETGDDDYEARFTEAIGSLPRTRTTTTEAYYKDFIETSPVGTVVRWDGHEHVVDVEDAKEAHGYPRLRREMQARGITAQDLMPYMRTNRLPTVYDKLAGNMGPLEPTEMESIYKGLFWHSGIRPYHLFQLDRFDIMGRQFEAEATADACRFLIRHMRDVELR